MRRGCGNMLVVAGIGAEEVTELIVASTEALREAKLLKPRIHRMRPFTPPVVLLEPMFL